MFNYSAKVMNIVDGDTVDLSVDLGFKIYSHQRIRLANIDTPERGQAGYNEAKDRLIELILGKEVILRTFKMSKWGYFLGEIYLKESDTSINEILLEEKLGVPYYGGKKQTLTTAS